MKKLIMILLALPLIGFGQTNIWSEDFANGIPATWTNSTAPWEYRGTSTSPSNSIGSQGAYASAGNPIVSATASNGFIIFDSDFYDNNGVAGAFGTGMYPTPHNGDLRTDMIDMSAYSDVLLTFNSYYRTFAGQAFVDFYVAGVFVERVQVHANIAVNDSTFTDEIALVRVPFSVVGNSDVQMSFVFEGTTNSYNGFSGYYFWQIDDLALVENPANQIEIEDVVLGGFWLDYASYSGLGFNGIVGLDYTVTPTSQLANHPYVIEGVLRNSGSTDQMSTLRYEDISGAYSGTSALTSVLAYSSTNTVDSVIVGATPLSPSLGTYTVAIWGESDSAGTITTTSDTSYKVIEISEYIYAKDLGEANSNNSWIIGGPGDQWHFTTRFEMYADEALSALRVYITDESVIGSEVKAIIYELDTTVSSASGGVVFLGESNNYTITSSDLGSWVDIPFVSPIDLYNGYAYEFGIAGFQHPTDSVVIGTTDNSLYNGEHSLFDEFGLSTQSFGTPTWYYMTRAPMVRMNFDPSFTQTTYGCTDPLACNYDTIATISDGSCNYPTTSTDNQLACDTYTWNGINYTFSGTYTYTTTNSVGCDSTATLNLIINNSSSSIETQEHCDTYTWIDGVTYTASNNIATYMFTTVDGCDSVVTLDLTINNSSSSTDVQVHCDTYTWVDGNVYTSSNNTATYMFTTVDGCDSLTTLDLTINNSSSSTDVQVHCDTYTWVDGNVYTASNNTATMLYTNAIGCDSTVTLDLTLNLSPTTPPILGNTLVAVSSLETYLVSQVIGSTYNWGITSNGGAIASGLPTNSIQVQWSSNVSTYELYVIETDINGCIGDTIFLEVTLNNSTVISNMKINRLAIYPNPSRDVFNITFTSESIQDLRVRILNVVGELIISEDLDQFIGEYTKKINLKENAKGIYFLEIETNDGIINEKLILQ